MPEKVFKPDTLVMFSGGLDSTGALWRLLKDEKQVHIHHMHLRNIERRAKAESVAVQRILSYLNGKFHFAYSESSHEYPLLNKQFMWDSDIASFVAGFICMATPWIKEVALGLTASDTNPDIEKRIERANQIFSAFTTDAKKIYPIKHLTKQNVYDLLPKEIKDATWSCRTPLYQNGQPFACLRCQACQETKKLVKT